MHQDKKLHVRDIILLALIGIIFGAIFMGTDFIYNALTVVLTPIGLAPMANDLMMGLFDSMIAMTLGKCRLSFEVAAPSHKMSCTAFAPAIRSVPKQKANAVSR